MRVQVATRLGVDESNSVSILEHSRRLRVHCVFGGEMWVFPSRSDDEFIVGVLVVVASDLLLLGSLRVRLDVRVKQSTSVAHVLECHLGAKGSLEGRIGKVVAPEMGLE